MHIELNFDVRPYTSETELENKKDCFRELLTEKHRIAYFLYSGIIVLIIVSRSECSACQPRSSLAF